MVMEENQKTESDLRRLILDTTRHLLVTDGYKRLSMRKIARAIGYSATSIYLHFESKDALVHTLIDERMARMYEAFQVVVAAHPDDPVARLAAVCRSYIDFGLTNPEYYEIMYLLHPEDMARFPVEKYRKARRNLEVIVATLAEGARQNRLVVADPLVAATAVWAALHGAVSLLFSGRLDVRIGTDAFVEAVVAQTVQAYARTPDGVLAR